MFTTHAKRDRGCQRTLDDVVFVVLDARSLAELGGLEEARCLEMFDVDVSVENGALAAR